MAERATRSLLCQSLTIASGETCNVPAHGIDRPSTVAHVARHRGRLVIVASARRRTWHRWAISTGTCGRRRRSWAISTGTCTWWCTTTWCCTWWCTTSSILGDAPSVLHRCNIPRRKWLRVHNLDCRRNSLLISLSLMKHDFKSKCIAICENVSTQFLKRFDDVGLEKTKTKPLRARDLAPDKA